MKNKILATLLAVCLFAGLAIPAFAVNDTMAEVASVKLGATTINVVAGVKTDIDGLVKAKFFGTDGKEMTLAAGNKITWTDTKSSKYFVVADQDITGSTAGISTTLKGEINNGVLPVLVTVNTIKVTTPTTISLPSTAKIGQNIDLKLTAKLNGNVAAAVKWTVDGVDNASSTNTEFTFNNAKVGNYAVKATIDVNGKPVSATTIVTVERLIPISAITLPETATVAMGGKLTLKVTFAPANANGNKEITWTEDSSEKIIKIDTKTGAITPVAEGFCVVTAKTADDKTASTVVKVTAKPVVVPSLKNSIGTLLVGETTKLVVLNAPKDAKLTYATLDAKKATVKDGVITAVAAGTTKITVTIEGVTAPLYYTVTVKAKPAPGKPGTGTDVPTTGDVLLTNLF